MYQNVNPKHIVFDFSSTKIKINSPQESQLVQQAMFANGCSWKCDVVQPAHTEEPFLYVNSKKCIGFGILHSFYCASNNQAITIQQILDAQKPVFEVGDIVKNKGTDTEYVVDAVQGENINMVGFPGIWVPGSAHYLIRKAKQQQEIIGYELLKDLPGIPAGSKSVEGLSVFGYTFKSNNGAHVAHFDGLQVKETTWFKPLYKPVNTVLKISGGRKVTVESKKVVLEDGAEFCSTQQLGDIYEAVKTRLLPTGKKSYDLEILTFKLGCHVFTKEDIVAVYQATLAY